MEKSKEKYVTYINSNFMEELLLEVKTIRKDISDLRIIVEKIRSELPLPVKKTDMPALAIGISGLRRHLRENGLLP